MPYEKHIRIVCINLIVKDRRGRRSLRVNNYVLCVSVLFVFLHIYITIKPPRMLFHPRRCVLLIHLILQPQIIGNHCDKLAISRLSAIASLREGGGPLAVEGACEARVDRLIFVSHSPSVANAPAPSQREPFYLYILYLSLKLSAIIAINSELVGFPLLF